MIFTQSIIDKLITNIGAMNWAQCPIFKYGCPFNNSRSLSIIFCGLVVPPLISIQVEQVRANNQSNKLSPFFVPELVKIPYSGDLNNILSPKNGRVNFKLQIFNGELFTADTYPKSPK